MIFIHFICCNSSLVEDATTAVTKLQGKEYHGRKLKLEVSIRSNTSRTKKPRQEVDDNDVNTCVAEDVVSKSLTTVSLAVEESKSRDNDNVIIDVKEQPKTHSEESQNNSLGDASNQIDQLSKKRKLSDTNADRIPSKLTVKTKDIVIDVDIDTEDASAANSLNEVIPDIIPNKGMKMTLHKKKDASDTSKPVLKVRPSMQLVVFGIPSEIDKKTFHKTLVQTMKISRKVVVELVKEVTMCYVLRYEC